jgi:hypothetical protein
MVNRKLSNRKKNKNINRNKSIKNNKIRKIFAKPKFSNEYMKSKEGEYFNEDHYDEIINEDCDCYRIDENGNYHLLFKLRKKVIPDKLCKIGIDNLKKAAMKSHDNRGASAGIIDYSKLEKLPSYANDPNQFKRVDKFRILGYKSKETGKWVNNSFGNISKSNIIGFFDKRDRNLGKNAAPCRTTAFTSQQVNKWDNVRPLIKCINKNFKTLVPDKYKKQYKQAQETKFVIKNTAFSTITINYNWRTALHKDSGDLKDGFGNLVIIEEGDYNGGSLGFPQFKLAADVRNGDFLAMDVHEWHCNTKITPITEDYTRLSLVSYLRENMIKCKHL